MCILFFWNKNALIRLLKTKKETLYILNTHKSQPNEWSYITSQKVVILVPTTWSLIHPNMQMWLNALVNKEAHGFHVYSSNQIGFDIVRSLRPHVCATLTYNILLFKFLLWQMFPSTLHSCLTRDKHSDGNHFHEVILERFSSNILSGFKRRMQ